MPAPQKSSFVEFEQEIEHLRSLISNPAVPRIILNNEPNENVELTYYTDKRRTILTSETFKI